MTDKELRRKLGDHIKRTRQEAGKLQCELAASAKIAKGYLCQIEGGIRMPSVQVLARIVNALGFTLSHFFTWSGL